MRLVDKIPETADKLEATNGRRKTALFRRSLGRAPDPDAMPKDLTDREEDSSEEGSGEDEPSCECEDDRCRDEGAPVWHCVDCDSSYCR